MLATPKPPSPKGRLPYLEGIRGLAALYVVIGHICTLSDPSASEGRLSHSPEWLRQFMSWFSYGHLAVAAFIVISGFCLELALFSREDTGIRSIAVFYLRRAQRILPPYYACLVISIFVAYKVTVYQVGAPFTQYLPIDQTTILAHFLLIHNFSLDWMYKINGVLWSIAIEAQLYVVFPLFVWSVNRLGRIVTLAAAGLIAYEIIVRVPLAPKMYIWYVPLFVGGIVSAHLAFKPTKLKLHPAMGWPATAGCLYGCYRFLYCGAPLYGSDLFMGAAIAGVCYTLARSPRGVAYGFLSLRPIVFLGSFSYSLYLMHHPIAQLLFGNRPHWVGGETCLFFYLVACLPIILFGCWAFYLVFERPFIPRGARKRRQIRKDHMPVSLPLKPYGSIGTAVSLPSTEKTAAAASLVEP